MRLSGFLSRAQAEKIHAQALRVLQEVGVWVDHPGVRERLAEVGGSACDTRVRFDPRAVEGLIAAAPKQPTPDEGASIRLGVGIFHSRYHDPETGALVPFNEERLARYVSLARHLPHAGGAGLLGVPFAVDGVPRSCDPLTEKLAAWKWGATPGGEVHFTHLCEPLLDLFACHAQATGRRIEEVFGAAGYLISPLRLARPECEQLLFFHQRGLRMSIGHLPIQGGTAPVTLAGAVVLALAEQIFLFLLRRSLWEDTGFALGSGVSTLDMRSGVSCYGRPEQHRVTLAFADLARFYGCACHTQGGLADAKLPSYEAGVQKACGALTAALATGHGTIAGGLLGVDEICSPIQMVLDEDLAGCLEALLAPAAAEEEDCAFDDILAVGPGGSFVGSDLTARRFRRELFQPRTWSAFLTEAWAAAGRLTDLDRARDFVRQFYAETTLQSHITEEEEADLRAIITRAARAPHVEAHGSSPADREAR